jgi:perosamine synthetase
MSHNIPLARPNVTQAEIDAVVAVLKTPTLSLGPKMEEFEAAVAAYCGTKHAVAVSSGTTGLHCIVHAMGIGPGDEVVTTPFSFVASSNCMLMVGATPVFVDIDPHTWNIDPARIEAAVTAKTKALLPVDVFGTVPDLERIVGFAKKRGLRVIEDSCEALGTVYRGRKAGSIGDAGCFGFYPNKQITTGEGGMIVTNDDTVAQLSKSYRNQGRDAMGGWLAHPRMGSNYRLSEINCALGLEQIRRIDDIIRPRTRVYDMYRHHLARESRVIMQAVSSDQEVSWFVCVVRLVDEYSEEQRNRILTGLRAIGIGCSNYFAPIHLQPFYTERFGFKPGDFPVCEAVAARSIALPFHHELTEANVETVCRELSRQIDALRK